MVVIFNSYSIQKRLKNWFLPLQILTSFRMLLFLVPLPKMTTASPNSRGSRKTLLYIVLWSIQIVIMNLLLLFLSYSCSMAIWNNICSLWNLFALIDWVAISPFWSWLNLNSRGWSKWIKVYRPDFSKILTLIPAYFLGPDWW